MNQKVIFSSINWKPRLPEAPEVVTMGRCAGSWGLHVPRCVYSLHTQELTQRNLEKTRPKL